MQISLLAVRWQSEALHHCVAPKNQIGSLLIILILSCCIKPELCGLYLTWNILFCSCFCFITDRGLGKPLSYQQSWWFKSFFFSSLLVFTNWVETKSLSNRVAPLPPPRMWLLSSSTSSVYHIRTNDWNSVELDSLWSISFLQSW